MAGRSLVGHMPLPDKGRMSTRTAMLRPYKVNIAYFTIRLFFTDLTPPTLLAISTALLAVF
jgi:hypothetical protein